MEPPIPQLDVLLPAHNEADSIAATVHEIYARVGSLVPMRFVLCEDGSTDGTPEILRELANTFPCELLLSEARKGYSRAVIDGMRASRAPFLLCLDADGQCDPQDFGRFWELREQADIVVGHRVARSDTWWRRALSRTFFLGYQLFFHVPVHDPSCPFVLASREVVLALLGRLGEMQQGFWWEFVARCHRMGFRILELPVRHRPRSAGITQVYRFRRLARIGWTHTVALGKIWWQTRLGALERKPQRS